MFDLVDPEEIGVESMVENPVYLEPIEEGPVPDRRQQCKHPIKNPVTALLQHVPAEPNP